MKPTFTSIPLFVKIRDNLNAKYCRVGYVQWTTSPPVLRLEQSTLTSHPVRNARLKRDTGKYADGHHLGPLATTSKKYKHVFAVIDAFSKFTWLYPTRSTDAAEVINRLENQRHVFGNPARIITDKGSAFTSSAFEDYCKKQNILHISITTGLPRSNGQIEKQNSTIIAVLSKLSVNDPEKWYSHVPHLQEILNSTFQRSIKMTPFELLFGTKMKSCQDIEIVELLNDEITAQFKENNVMLSVKMPKSKSTKSKMRIAARTISDADKLININYMT
ncbi:hypothetical protein TNCV_3824741 [Trichonephila clavipes]|nr:hypothetical protein TNCV_3824741 [Trichonephila clavipes]